MTRFARASLLFVLVAACGGEVKIGTLASQDGGVTGSEQGPNYAGVCPSSAEVETLHTFGSDDEIYDYVGNGTSVAAAIGLPTKSAIVLFPASETKGTSGLGDTYARVRVLTSTATRAEIRLGNALDRVFFGVGGQGVDSKIGYVTWDGEDERAPTVDVAPSFVVSDPHRRDVFYHRRDAQSGPEAIVHWDPTSVLDSTSIMSAPVGWQVSSMAASEKGMVALLNNPGADDLTFRIVRSPEAELIARSDTVVSNVVLDGERPIVAEYDGSTKSIKISRYDGVNQLPRDAVQLGSFPLLSDDPISREYSYLAIDDAYVYAARASSLDCESSSCTVDLDVFRFKRDGSDANEILSPYKSVTAAKPNGSLRPFTVDGCYFIWYNANMRTLFRQPKESLD